MLGLPSIRKKSPYEKMKIDLNAPSSEGFRDQPEDTETTTTEVSQTKSGEEGTGTSAHETVVDEPRVPYSRIEKATRLREEAEERAAKAEARYDALLQSRQPTYERETDDTSDPLYNQIVKLYGDTDQAKEIYKIQKSQFEALEERAYQKALEATRNSRDTESKVERENISTIDERLYELSEDIGRSLTEAEEESLLDIVDEYTPKDGEGNYLGGDTISYQKAWEIHEMMQASNASTSKRARSTATSLTGSQSSGEPTLEQKKQANENFNPMGGFGQWRRRFNN